MAEVKVFDKDMNEIILPGITWIEFEPDSPGADIETEKIGNREVVVSIQKTSRMVTCKFMLQTSDVMYYKLMRDDMFHLLDPTQFIYVIDMGVGGKRWGGYMQGGYTVDRVRGDVAIMSARLFSPSPYAESRATTMSDFNYLEEMWSYGMGLVYDESYQQYIHNTSSFIIYNAGNQVVDPREFELLIKIKSTGGTASTITLLNASTNDTWSYNGPFANGDEITLDGVKMLKNAANIAGDTNFGLITLKPGQNEMSLSGITGSFEISFEFRYLYA